MSEFYAGMAEILEVDEVDVSPDYAFGDKWDSLAVVSTIALIDEVYGTAVGPDQLQDCQTVGEVEALAKAAAGQ